MTLYRIKNWKDTFENNRTRELKRLDWFPVPNKHDGDGYTELLEHQNGMAHYGAWLLIVAVASKCDVRGTLLRDGAVPHDARSLARKTRGSAKVFEEAIPRLLSIGWLEIVPCTAGVSDEVAVSCGNPAPPCGEVPMEGNGREWKGTTKGAVAPVGAGLRELVIPKNLSSPEFIEVWERWIPFRKKIKGCKDWIALFQEQINWLKDFPESMAIEIVKQSIRNGWQGLFPIKGESALGNQLEFLENRIATHPANYEFKGHNPKCSEAEQQELEDLRKKRKEALNGHG